MPLPPPWIRHCRSHIWQRRPSSMANKTGTGKRACAPNYFRFMSLLGLCPRYRSHFSSDFNQIWNIDPLCQFFILVTQSEVICTHAHNLTSVFTNLLKIPSNVGLQANCPRLIVNMGRWIYFQWQICDRE